MMYPARGRFALGPLARETAMIRRHAPTLAGLGSFLLTAMALVMAADPGTTLFP